MDRLADTQRALIEAAERRGYDRGRADAEAELAALRARIAETARRWRVAAPIVIQSQETIYNYCADGLAALLPAEGDEGGASV